MTADDRFKWLYANTVARLCQVEAQLEQANERIAELERELVVTSEKKNV